MNELSKFLKKNRNLEINDISIIVYSILQSKEIEKEISKYFKNTKIVITENKEILGGYIIKLNDLMLDESYKSRLMALQSHIDNIKLHSQDSVIDDLKRGTKEFKAESSINEIGEVISLKDGICSISGLKEVMNQEILMFENNIKCIAFNLDMNEVGAIILGDYTKIKTGDRVIRTKQVVSVPVDESLLGRVINPLGETIDGKENPDITTYYPIEKLAPGVLDRQPVNQPLQTGIKAIDILVPIGKGQRELILGDRQTGKTALAIDTIINQKDTGVISIYVAIGQKMSKIVNIVERLKKYDAMKNTIVVAAGASDPAPLLFLAPFSASAIAEYFADKGKDVLIIYDDLSKHAIAYREISLLLRRPPGREAFPGDVFYLHSRLLERSVKLSNELGAGSITSLPIIETQAGDISAYIPTNVISITDGQIFLESNLFNKGIRPAINVGLSVSRVGSAAQTKAMKKVAGKIKISLAQYRELEAFSQFAGDLDNNTKSQLNRGQKTIELLKQNQYEPYSLDAQVISTYAVNNGYFDNIEITEIKNKENNLINYMRKNHEKLSHTLLDGIWNEEVEKEIDTLCKEFFSSDEY